MIVDAGPGHTYEVSGACVRVASQDATTEGDIVVCEPGMTGPNDIDRV